MALSCLVPIEDILHETSEGKVLDECFVREGRYGMESEKRILAEAVRSFS
jgi:hypothetical protein